MNFKKTREFTLNCNQNSINETQEFSLNEEVIYKKPIKRPNINNKNQQNSSIFEGSYNNENNDSKNLGAKVLNHNKTYKNVDSNSEIGKNSVSLLTGRA